MADVGVSLGIDAQELYQELQNVTTKFVQFSQQTEQAGGNAGKGFAEKFKAGLGGVGTNLTQALGALGLGHEIKDVVEYGAHIEDLSRRFGVSAVALQKFGNAAELNGSSLEATAKAFRFLEVNQAKALGGNDAMIEAFRELGVTVEDLKTLRPEDIMLKLGQSSLNAADIVKVLGKSALELRPTLAGLADGTIHFGNAISDIDVARLKQVDDTFKTLHQTVTIFIGTGLGAFFTGLQATIADFVGHFEAGMERVKGYAASVKDFFKGDLKQSAKDVEIANANAENYIKGGQEEAAKYFTPDTELDPTTKTAKAQQERRVRAGDPGFGTEHAGEGEAEKKPRDLGLAPEESEAGKSDDQGRPLKQTAEQRKAARESQELDQERSKVREIERQKHLESLPYEARLSELQREAGSFQTGSNQAATEKERLDLKLKYFDVAKEISELEGKHAKEIQRAEQEKTRERQKEEKETVSRSHTAKLEEAEPLSLADAARKRDEDSRRAHGSFTGPGGRGGETSGLRTGHVEGSGGLTSSGLSPYLSTEDFHDQFRSGNAKALRDISLKEQVSRGLVGKDSDKEKHLPVAEKQLTALEKIEKNTQDMGKNK